MTDYNTSQSEILANAFNPDTGQQPSVDDYRRWANQLSTYSVQIHDTAIAKNATTLADEAHQLVVLVDQARSDTSAPADPEAPPPWVKPYSTLSKQFHDNLAALDAACPKS